MERLVAQTGQTRSLAGRRHVEQVLAEGKAHGIPEPVQSRPPQRAPAKSLTQQLKDLTQRLEDAPTAGATLRVQLHREREQDRGMGF